MHIPKCAGTSLRTSLESLPGVVVGPKYHDPYLMAIRAGGTSPTDRDPLAYTIEELADLRLRSTIVMGHIGVKAFLDAGFTSVRILVREPRSRLLSLFDHYSRVSRHRPPIERRTDALIEFLESEFTRVQGNNFIFRMIAATTVDNRSFDAITSAGHEDDLRNMLVSELDRSIPVIDRVYWDSEVARLHVDLLHERFPDTVVSDPGDFPQENVAPEPTTLEPLGGEPLHLLEKHTVLGRAVIDSFVRAGLLTPRSEIDLHSDFVVTARRHGFLVE